MYVNLCDVDSPLPFRCLAPGGINSSLSLSLGILDRVIFWVQPWAPAGCGQTTAAMVFRRIAGRNRGSSSSFIFLRNEAVTLESPRGLDMQKTWLAGMSPALQCGMSSGSASRTARNHVR
jgi:hypothetical protein